MKNMILKFKSTWMFWNLYRKDMNKLIKITNFSSVYMLYIIDYRIFYFYFSSLFTFLWFRWLEINIPNFFWYVSYDTFSSAPPFFPLSGCVFTFSCAITIKWVDVYMLKLTLEFAYSSSFTWMIMCINRINDSQYPFRKFQKQRKGSDFKSYHGTCQIV